MKVKIKNCTKKTWYRQNIGDIFKVEDWDNNTYKVKDKRGIFFLLKQDCEVIDELS